MNIFQKTQKQTVLHTVCQKAEGNNDFEKKIEESEFFDALFIPQIKKI